MPRRTSDPLTTQFFEKFSKPVPGPVFLDTSNVKMAARWCSAGKTGKMADG
jgi:hypothetical protein